jgi:hypothetical protein
MAPTNLVKAEVEVNYDGTTTIVKALESEACDIVGSENGYEVVDGAYQEEEEFEND